MDSWIWTVLVALCLLGSCSDEENSVLSQPSRTTQSGDGAQEQGAGDQVDIAQRCTVSREDQIAGGFLLAPGNKGCVVRVKNADKEASIHSLTGLVCFGQGERNEVTGIKLRRVPRIARLIGGELSISGGSEFLVEKLDVEPGVTVDIFVELAATPRKGYSIVFEAEFDQ